jgi:hypothetical protein
VGGEAESTTVTLADEALTTAAEAPSADREPVPTAPVPTLAESSAAKAQSIAASPARPATSPFGARGGAAPTSAAAAPESRSADTVAGTDRPMIAAVDAAWAPRRDGLTMTSAIQQNVLVGTEDRSARPELSVRFGGAFDDGGHNLFGIVGFATYNETTTRSSLRMEVGIRGGDSTLEEEEADAAKGELWGGIGYRYVARVSDRWRIGAGAWAGLGERFSRVAAEIPAAYQIARNVSFELTPTIEIVTARSDASAMTAFDRMVTPQAIVVESESVSVTDSELRYGLGIGLTITFD